MHGLAQNLSFFNYNLIRNKEGGSKDDHLNVELVNKNLLKTTFSLSEDSSQDELEARLLAAIWAVVDFSNIQDLSIIASQKTSSDALNAIGEYISNKQKAEPLTFNDKSLIKTLYALLKTVRKFNVNPSVYQDFVRLKREKYNTNGIILTNSFLNSNNSNTAWTSYFKAVLAFEDKLTTADSALTDGRVRNIFDLNEALLTEAEKKKLIAQLKNHADSKYDDLHPKKSAPQKQFISPRHLTPLHSVTSNSNSNSDSDSDDDDQNATVRIIQSKNPLSDTEIVSDIIASIHRAFPNFNSVNNLETLIEQINEKINKNQMTPFELLNQLIQNDGVYAALLFIKHFKDFTFPEVTALLQTLKEHDPTTTNIKILIKLQNICSEKKQVIITPLIYLIQQNEISKATQLVEGFLADSKYDNAVLGITGLDSYGNRLDPLTLLLDKKSKETNDNKIDHLINLLTPLSKEFNLEQSASSSKSDEFQDL